MGNKISEPIITASNMPLDIPAFEEPLVELDDELLPAPGKGEAGVKTIWVALL